MFEKFSQIKDFKTAIKIFNFLNKNPIQIKSQPNWELIDKITCCSNPEPLSEDGFFAISLLKEHQNLITHFKSLAKKTKKYLTLGCPMGLDCREMGLNKGILCENLSHCIPKRN